MGGGGGEVRRDKELERQREGGGERSAVYPEPRGRDTAAAAPAISEPQSLLHKVTLTGPQQQLPAATVD